MAKTKELSYCILNGVKGLFYSGEGHGIGPWYLTLFRLSLASFADVDARFGHKSERKNSGLFDRYLREV